MLKSQLVPEYIPIGLEFVSPERLGHREVDLECDMCGVLGGGTLSANDGIKLAIDHENINKDHNVKIVEVVCFM